MNKKIEEIFNSLTFEEKISLLTGAGSMATAEIGRLGLKAKRFADGPHGVRIAYEENCISFPSMCLVGSTWDTELINKMGVALAKDCIEHDIDMLLGPGVNIKRHILCGRNFEYISEDPQLAGEIAAAYINGLQSLGVGASLKHYAANNQEKYRTTINVDTDIRTLMELYLKAFEIAVKKSSPASVMCAYNKLFSIWCSENKFLLTEVLRDMWNYDGFVVSDWGAVHCAPRAFHAGLDMQMPQNANLLNEVCAGLENGQITMNEIDTAVKRMIKFVLKRPEGKGIYDREEQHRVAREIASAGMVLLKNDNYVLPITSEKYKKIAVIGEFAKNPLINGQGSANVNVMKEYIDSPYNELEKILSGDIELIYKEVYKKSEFSGEMLWPKKREFNEFINDSDLVVMFIGAMESEDTEMLDRRTAEFNPNYEMFVDEVARSGKKVVVVIQSGSAMILGDWKNNVDAIVQMWLGGESAGGAIADILCGKVNPSGRLSETFPSKLRSDMKYPGNEYTIEYSEKLLVGYRYYDLHPEEIVYPFGHGLSYADFKYNNMEINKKDNKIEVSFDLKNVGKVKGAEVVQLYVGDPVSTVVRPLKELKAFKKIMLNSGESQRVQMSVEIKDMGYYNVALKDWVTEPGEYIIYIGASSQDIRLKESVFLNTQIPYTIGKNGESMIG